MSINVPENVLFFISTGPITGSTNTNAIRPYPTASKSTLRTGVGHCIRQSFFTYTKRFVCTRPKVMIFFRVRKTTRRWREHAPRSRMEFSRSIVPLVYRVGFIHGTYENYMYALRTSSVFGRKQRSNGIARKSHKKNPVNLQHNRNATVISVHAFRPTRYTGIERLNGSPCTVLMYQFSRKRQNEKSFWLAQTPSLPPKLVNPCTSTYTVVYHRTKTIDIFRMCSKRD